MSNNQISQPGNHQGGTQRGSSGLADKDQHRADRNAKTQREVRRSVAHRTIRHQSLIRSKF
jgi:hypothetical protein